MPFKKNYKNILSPALSKGEFKSRRFINIPPDPSVPIRTPVKFKFKRSRFKSNTGERLGSSVG